MKYAAVTGSVASSEFASPLPEPEAGMTPNGILRAISQSCRASYEVSLSLHMPLIVIIIRVSTYQSIHHFIYCAVSSSLRSSRVNTAINNIDDIDIYTHHYNTVHGFH